MITATIQIGNSDNKLTQQEWSQFIDRIEAHVETLVEDNLARAHFFGCSAGRDQWQNAAWVIELYDDEAVARLRNTLSSAAARFKQDSIALTLGATQFVS